MSYRLCDNSHYRLTQTRDVIRLLKHTSQQAETGNTLETDLLASYMTLIDEQLSQVLADMVFES